MGVALGVALNGVFHGLSSGCGSEVGVVFSQLVPKGLKLEVGVVYMKRGVVLEKVGVVF